MLFQNSIIAIIANCVMNVLQALSLLVAIDGIKDLHTKEYLKLLCDVIQAIKYEEIQMPPIADPDGYEYYTTIFLMAVF